MLPLVSSVPLGTSSVFTALSVGGAKCGTKVCEIFQFCSKYHSDCEDCAPICDENNHNFDKELCITDCQNYLRDRNYEKLYNHVAGYADEIKKLKIYVSVTFIISVLVLILFLITNGPKMFRMCSRLFAKMKSPVKKNKPVPEPVMMANPHTVSPKMRPKLQTNNHQNNLNRSSSVFTVTGTEFEAKTVSTPISTRYPAEDTLTSSATVTPDYSYDNKALQLTPVHEEKPRIETTF